MKIFSKIALVSILVVVLQACATTSPTVITKVEVLHAPSQLYNCPLVKKPANIDVITNKELGNFIAQLSRTNRVCKYNMDAIRKFYDQAEQQLKK